MRLIALLVALSASACGFSHFSDGPRYAEIPSERVPEGYGLVYVYRKPRGWGAGWIYTLSWQSRRFAIPSGAYGVFALPEGTQTFGSTVEGGGFSVEVRRDQPVFVEISFGTREKPQKTEIVDADRGRKDIRSCHLGAGGGARLPVPPLVPTIPRGDAADVGRTDSAAGVARR